MIHKVLLHVWLLQIICSVELGCAQLECLVSLVFRAREHNDIAAHFGRELDGEVSEPTDPYHAHCVPWSHVCPYKGDENCLPGAHERAGELRRDRLGDLSKAGSRKNAVRRPRRCVVVVCAVVVGTLGAVIGITRQAVCAVSAAAADVAYADSVSSGLTLAGLFEKEGEGACLRFQILHVSPDFLDDADTFVAEDYTTVREVHVCAAETGVLVLDENFIRPRGISGDLGLDDSARFGASEGCVFDLGRERTHGGRLSWLMVRSG